MCKANAGMACICLVHILANPIPTEYGGKLETENEEDKSDGRTTWLVPHCSRIWAEHYHRTSNVVYRRLATCLAVRFFRNEMAYRVLWGSQDWGLPEYSPNSQLHFAAALGLDAVVLGLPEDTS